MRPEEEGEVKGRTNTSRDKKRRIKMRECRERKEETKKDRDERRSAGI